MADEVMPEDVLDADPFSFMLVVNGEVIPNSAPISIPEIRQKQRVMEKLKEVNDEIWPVAMRILEDMLIQEQYPSHPRPMSKKQQQDYIDQISQNRQREWAEKLDRGLIDCSYKTYRRRKQMEARRIRHQNEK